MHCTLNASCAPKPPGSSAVSNANVFKKASQRAAHTASDPTAPTLVSSTFSRPRAPTIGVPNLPLQGETVAGMAGVAGLDAGVAVTFGAFVEHLSAALLNSHPVSARQFLEDKLKHGSRFPVVMAVDVVVVGNEHAKVATSNAHPVATQFFFLKPAHGLKRVHCFTPLTELKTQPSTAEHLLRFKPSHTLPLPSALLQVLDALSNTHPDVFLHALPLRPLHTLRVHARVVCVCVGGGMSIFW